MIGNLTPTILPEWDEKFQLLLQNCWSFYPEERPTMKDVKKILEDLEASTEKNNILRTQTGNFV